MKKKIKVMAFGTFDVLHPGHLDFLKQAKALGDYLIVSVSRDINAKKFKGYKPVFHEADRLDLVKNLKMVDKAVLGDKKNYLKHILAENPDIIVLGYDQKAYQSSLRKDIQSAKLKAKIVRLKAFKPTKYKSAKYKNFISKNYTAK